MIYLGVLEGVMQGFHLLLLAATLDQDLHWTVILGGLWVVTGPLLVVGLGVVLESLGLVVLHAGVKVVFLTSRSAEIILIILKTDSGKGPGLIDQCHWIGKESGKEITY